MTHGAAYKYEDLLTIAKGQLALEDAHAAPLTQGSSFPKITSPVSMSPESLHQTGNLNDPNSKLLFIDTDMYVMKVWSEFVFGKCDPWILEQIIRRKYDGYLLCQTDLPWTADELREYPDPVTREKLFHIYKDCLINQDTPWSEVSGQAGQRLEGAIRAVDKQIS
jgi:nicotinamide riboside kinase